MKLKPIINSPIETDAYKLNMQAVVLEKFNQDRCRWAFRCRNNNVFFTPEMVQEISEQIDHFCSLSFSDDEREWLSKNFSWLGQSYIDFLRYWHPWRNQITINKPTHAKYNDCGLTIEACGSWLDTMMYEIPILAIVNEVYFAFKYGVGALDESFVKRAEEKIDKLSCGHYRLSNFSEFGLRRRYSSKTQDWVVGQLACRHIGSESHFVGTSNVYLAKKYGIKAVGTQAHEFFMAQQGHHEINPAYSNRFALTAWNDYYKTKLGIALTDTIGTDVFLRDFDENFAALFSGVRHDSGDPIVWGEKMIMHYKKLGIDPMTKTLLFSDSLDFDRATKIKAHFVGKSRVAFGIGTYITNDTGVEPLNIVMKMVECNGTPVAKLSNTPSKGMCLDTDYVNYLSKSIDWRMRYGL